MAQTTPTKAELENILNEVENLVDEALDPELTREQIVVKLKEIADLVSSEEDDEEEDDEDGGDEEDGE